MDEPGVHYAKWNKPDTGQILRDCSYRRNLRIKLVGTDHDSFNFSLPIWIPFIASSSLIAMARTSKTMLNNSGKSGHPCLVPNFGRNAFSFSPLRTKFAVGSSYGLYYAKEVFLNDHFLESFYHTWVLNFAESFSWVCWDDHMVSILQFVNMVYHRDWLAYIEEFLHPRDKSNLIYLKGKVLQLLRYFGSLATGGMIEDSWRASCPQGEQQPVLISFSPFVPLVLGLPWWFRQ